MYQILSLKPIQLVMECSTGSNITTIQGVFLLRLTADCPKASTPEHLFVRTLEFLLGSQELISLPLLTQSQDWLGEVDLELDLSKFVVDESAVPSPRRSVSLQRFS